MDVFDRQKKQPTRSPQPAMTDTLEPTLTKFQNVFTSGNALKALILVVSFLYWSSLYFYVPTLPVYIEERTGGLALVGMVLSMYGLWQAVVRLPLGIAADWVGRRKPFIIIGLGLAALGAWLLGTSDTISSLTLGRAITGLAAGAWVPLVVIFTSMFPSDQVVRASAILTLVSSLSRMLATGLNGSLIQLGGYSLAFNLSAGVALLAILVMLAVKEKPRPVQRPSLGGLGRFITRRDILLPSLLSAVMQYATWATTFGFLPLLAERLGASEVVQGVLVSLNIGVIVIGNLLTSTLSNRVSPRLMVLVSYVIIAAGILAAALTRSLIGVFIAQIAIGLSNGINYPVLMGMSIERVEESQRTTAMGVYQSVYAIGMFTGPWLSGILADWIGIQPMFAVTAGACLLLGILGLRQVRPAARV
jgi:MFS family permease